MKLHIAILAVCAGAFVLAPAIVVASSNKPIPGIDIIVRKEPGGTAIKVGDCQAGGGKVVEKGTAWICTGFPAPAKQKTQSR